MTKPSESPFLIAQISDTHLAGWEQRTFGTAPMGANLTRCVNHINNLIPQPNLVLVTGDLTNSGLLEETKRVAEILKQLQPPFYIVPGNHDDRDTLRKLFSPTHCPTEDDVFLHYVIEGHPLRLIALDSIRPNAPGGEICASRAAWLEARLAESPQSPTVLFLHHPPLRMGLIETDLDGFLGVERLEEILRQHPNIIRILAGHIHLASLAAWHGTIVSTAPSPGMHLFVDLTLQRSAYLLDAPAYQLHYWTPEAHLVTHTIHLPDSDTHYPFAPL
jgi:3',5'-cyclic AMP phosphodiesterase CpdA